MLNYSRQAIKQLFTVRWKEWKREINSKFTACEAIRELEDAISHERELNRGLQQEMSELRGLAEDLKKTRYELESKLTIREQLEEQRLFTIREQEQEIEKLEGDIAVQRAFVQEQVSRISFLEMLYREEKQERRELSDRIQEATGFKERSGTVAEIGSKTTDEAWDALSSHRRTRSQIKRELEERAERILKQNQEREGKAVQEGKLAEVVSMDEVKNAGS